MNEENNNFNNQFNNTNNLSQGPTPIQNNQNFGPIPPMPAPQVTPQESSQMINPQPTNFATISNQSVNQNQTNIEQPFNQQPINAIPNIINNEEQNLTGQIAQNINPAPVSISPSIPLATSDNQNNLQPTNFAAIPSQSASPEPNLIQNNEIPAQSIDNQVKKEKHKNNNILIIISIVAIIAVLAILYITFIYGTKTLNCTMTDNTNGMNMKTDLTVNFKRNQANSLKATITVDLGEYIDYKDTLIDAYKDEFEQQDGIKTNIKSDGDKVILEMTATRAGMEVSGYVKSDTYDEVIDSLKDEGYTCN